MTNDNRNKFKHHNTPAHQPIGPSRMRTSCNECIAPHHDVKIVFLLLCLTCLHSLVKGTFVNYYTPQQSQSRIHIEPIEPTITTTKMTTTLATTISARTTKLSSTKLHLKINLVENIEKILFGSIFPVEDEIKPEDPRKELASFTNLTTTTTISSNDDSDGCYYSSRDVSRAHDSLAAFLLQWGKTLEKADGLDKLPTPVFCIPLAPRNLSTNMVGSSRDDDGGNAKSIGDEETQGRNNYQSEEDGCTVIKTTGVKISFRKTKRYLSRNEQRGLEKGEVPDRKGAKIDLWSPGGILLLVQTVVCRNTVGEMDEAGGELVRGHQLRLLVRRCDIDGDTVVKVSSERTIVRRLKEAIRIWSKMRSS